MAELARHWLSFALPDYPPQRTRQQQPRRELMGAGLA
jgi:hypothetical protein